MAISFKTQPGESKLIQQIVNRAVAMAEEHGPQHIDPTDPASLSMDLIACNANGCPIDFEALLAVDDGTFGHDVFGIRKHMDRETGRLVDSFVPRTAKRDTANT